MTSSTSHLFLLPPRWHASLSHGRVVPRNRDWIPQNPFVHLGEERHCESKLSWPRAQHNVPGHDSTVLSPFGVKQTNHKANSPPLTEINFQLIHRKENKVQLFFMSTCTVTCTCTEVYVKRPLYLSFALGATTFPGLRKFIAEKSQTRVLSLLHIAAHGLASAGCTGWGM